jgi:hypothetical protein
MFAKCEVDNLGSAVGGRALPRALAANVGAGCNSTLENSDSSNSNASLHLHPLPRPNVTVATPRRCLHSHKTPSPACTVVFGRAPPAMSGAANRQGKMVRTSRLSQESTA